MADVTNDPWDEFPILGNTPSADHGAGPVYGAPPKPRDAPSGYQWNAHGGLDPINGGPADPRSIEPKLPAGYRWAADGSAERIPGLPVDGSSGDGVGRAMTANKRSELQDSLTSLQQFEQDLNLIEKSYQENFQHQGLATPREYLPDWASPTNQTYNQASDRLLPLVARALGFTSKQMDTPAEIARLKAYVPQNTDTDEAASQKIEALRGMLNRQRANITSQLGSVDGLSDSDLNSPLSNKDIKAGREMLNNAEENQVPPARPPFSEGEPIYQPATNDYRRVADGPLAAKVDSLVRQGASLDEINRFVVSQGREPVDPRQYAAVAAFIRKNPEYKGSLAEAWNYEPVSTFEKVATAVGGSGPGAFAIGAGQFLSGNTLDNIAPDPARARLALDIAQEQNPTSYAAGEIAGGVMAGLSGEAALGRVGMAPGMARSAIVDAATGAANGAGAADDGNRLEGAAWGAGASAAGGAAGTLGTRAAAKVLNPSGGSLRPLYDAGVRPTPGQRFADSGAAGRMLNAAEEKLQSVPIVGSAIRGARQDARDHFQVGAFNEALREIGEQLPPKMGPGTEAHKFAQAVFDRVYAHARAGMIMVRDDELTTDLMALGPEIEVLGPQAQVKLRSIMKNYVNSKVSEDGVMTGLHYKEAVSDLGKHIAKLRKGSTSEDQGLADVLGGIIDAMNRAARRHSASESVELLDAADTGYAKLVRIEEAAARRGGDQGTFGPGQFDAAVQKTGGGVRSKAYLRGDALMQDYAKAGRSLEDRIPNSGTADRLLSGGAAVGATAAAAFSPKALALLGSIAVAYAPGVRKVTTGAFAPGRTRAKLIANQLAKRAQLAGRASAASGATLLPETADGP